MVKFRKSWNSLAGKLILAVGIVLSLGSAFFGFIFFKYEESVTIRNLTNHAQFSTSLVLKGINNGMLTARRDIIQTTIEEQGALPDVKELIIYDTAGNAVYASDPERLGKMIDPSNIEFRNAVEGNFTKPSIEGEDGFHGTVLTSFTPIRNEPSCFLASCHFHPKEEKVLGVLYTSFSASSIETASRQILFGTLLFGAFFVAMISVFLCIILYKLVSKPVALIEEGMKRVARGDFDHPIQVDSADEMGILASTFNAMASDISRYEQKLKNWAEELQREVDKKTKEIVEAQEQLVNAEKLASLGRMSAGVAHELNSPLTGIITYAHLLQERIPQENTDDHEDLQVIIDQAQRCTTIIKGLLRFSRKGGSEKIEINVNEILENAISMVRNQQNFLNIEIHLNLSETLSDVLVDANQIQQVILNLLSNAVDAMNGNGKLTISTGMIIEGAREFVEMSFSDTGPGIIPEHLGRIFEPFFTTKPVGKGTGLGLPVSYGIIKRHGGDILVRSKSGEGTIFLVRLPSGANAPAIAGEESEEVST
ncbi:MAG: HAMP domain-containing protein [candidate division Zixibacteria bacterium]|nr:HAMP domain-containing protein [candidate division Zixibacteria bacterium]NIS46836.1 HAMP domain-containing protein [candidate division Zixibacteria bacterium]NIU14981.1 HAMP domain-containing protein [candidate division Zixibacteria bacterium]NIV06997.1 HAMP domain-containing protein [candidate division Zixibacteria bacterium]NIW42330.1 HAMP domain-containing protein [candidate division Zixibacteria bacterium]